MKEVKTQKRYKCDFCKRRGIKRSIEHHEQICFRNPNRLCPMCKNKGYWIECHGDLIEDGDCGLNERIECEMCAKFDPIKLAEIEARERGQAPDTSLAADQIPF